MSVGDQSGLERDIVTGSVFVPITLSAPAAEPVVVSYWTADGTATAGVDYLRWGTPTNPRTVTIPTGAVQTQVNVPVLPDSDAEPDETFSVATATGGDVVVGDDTGTATIIDADAVSGSNPAITVSNPTVVEGDQGTGSPSSSCTSHAPRHERDDHLQHRRWHRGCRCGLQGETSRDGGVRTGADLQDHRRRGPPNTTADGPGT